MSEENTNSIEFSLGQLTGQMAALVAGVRALTETVSNLEKSQTEKLTAVEKKTSEHIDALEKKVRKLEDARLKYGAIITFIATVCATGIELFINFKK